MCNSNTVANIFNQGFEAYCSEKQLLPIDHYKVANAIMACRTARLGGHTIGAEPICPAEQRSLLFADVQGSL